GRFVGKVAVVSGAAGGIGLAICRRLALEGAAVVLADRNAEAGEKACAELRSQVSGAQVRFRICDVSSEEDVEATVELAVSVFGRLDVVVNNAGLMVFKPIEEHRVEDWNKVLSVDLIGA